MSNEFVGRMPTDAYPSTREWAITAANGNSDALNQLYKVIYPEEICRVLTPKGVWPDTWPMDWRYREAFVALVPGGRILSTGYVVTPDGKRLADMELPIPYEIDELPPVIDTPENVGLLLWGLSMPEHNAFTQNNYGHWFLDILPRIHLLERSGWRIDKYVIGKLIYHHQYESLRLLGIMEDRLIQVDSEHFHLRAANVLVPAVPRMLCGGGYPRWISSFYREHVLAGRTIERMDGFERLYISRADSGVRTIANDAQLFEALAAKGYRRVVLTGMTVHDQIRLFQTAESIVSPFGANLTNLLFCRPGTKVFELSPVTMPEVAYWQISSHGELDYHHLVCDIQQPPKPSGSLDNLIVDIPKLLRLLEQAGV